MNPNVILPVEALTVTPPPAVKDVTPRLVIVTAELPLNEPPLRPEPIVNALATLPAEPVAESAVTARLT